MKNPFSIETKTGTKTVHLGSGRLGVPFSQMPLVTIYGDDSELFLYRTGPQYIFDELRRGDAKVLEACGLTKSEGMKIVIELRKRIQPEYLIPSVNMLAWDRIIAEQEEIQGPAMMKLIRAAAEDDPGEGFEDLYLREREMNHASGA